MTAVQSLHIQAYSTCWHNVCLFNSISEKVKKNCNKYDKSLVILAVDQTPKNPWSTGIGSRGLTPRLRFKDKLNCDFCKISTNWIKMEKLISLCWVRSDIIRRDPPMLDLICNWNLVLYLILCPLISKTLSEIFLKPCAPISWVDYSRVEWSKKGKQDELKLDSYSVW